MTKEHWRDVGALTFLFDDPPLVHPRSRNATGFEVWSTERTCYEYIESRVAPGMATLETGLGLSTALFLLLGAHHTCVVESLSEIERFYAFCESRGIDTHDLVIRSGPSDIVLPQLEPAALDLLLIDGGHDFPIPMIDWFFAAFHLRERAALVIDDLQLAAPSMLDRVLATDARWSPERRTTKWAAYLQLDPPDSWDEWRNRKPIKRMAAADVDGRNLAALASFRSENSVFGPATPTPSPADTAPTSSHFWVDDCGELTAYARIVEGQVDLVAATSWGVHTGQAVALLRYLQRGEAVECTPGQRSRLAELGICVSEIGSDKGGG